MKQKISMGLTKSFVYGLSALYAVTIINVVVQKVLADQEIANLASGKVKPVGKWDHIN